MAVCVVLHRSCGIARGCVGKVNDGAQQGFGAAWGVAAIGQLSSQWGVSRHKGSQQAATTEGQVEGGKTLDA